MKEASECPDLEFTCSGSCFMLFEPGDPTEAHPTLLELPSRILFKCLSPHTKKTRFHEASCVVLGEKFTKVQQKLNLVLNW